MPGVPGTVKKASSSPFMGSSLSEKQPATQRVIHRTTTLICQAPHLYNLKSHLSKISLRSSGLGNSWRWQPNLDTLQPHSPSPYQKTCMLLSGVLMPSPHLISLDWEQSCPPQDTASGLETPAAFTIREVGTIGREKPKMLLNIKTFGKKAQYHPRPQIIIWPNMWTEWK